MQSVVRRLVCFVCGRHFEKAIDKMFGKRLKKLEPVNLAVRMEELGLDNLFPSEAWPEAAPCRELRTKVKSNTGEGFANPYVYADLRKCVLNNGV